MQELGHETALLSRINHGFGSIAWQCTLPGREILKDVWFCFSFFLSLPDISMPGWRWHAAPQALGVLDGAAPRRSLLVLIVVLSPRCGALLLSGNDSPSSASAYTRVLAFPIIFQNSKHISNSFAQPLQLKGGSACTPVASYAPICVSTWTGPLWVPMLGVRELSAAGWGCIVPFAEVWQPAVTLQHTCGGVKCVWWMFPARGPCFWGLHGLKGASIGNCAQLTSLPCILPLLFFPLQLNIADALPLIGEMRLGG